MKESAEMKDLHALTRQLGIVYVAAAIGVTPRNLEDLRSGRTPLNVDHLQRLAESFPEFDLIGTVARLAERRREKGIASRGVTS